MKKEKTPKELEEEIKRSLELRTTQHQLRAAIQRENELKSKNVNLENQLQNMKLLVEKEKVKDEYR